MKLDCILYETKTGKEWDGTTIKSLVITKASPRTYQGRVACEEHSPDGGPFELGWKAKRTKNRYKITPADRSGIELCGMLADNQFTHSPDCDKKLREYITEEIAKFEHMNKEKR